jgi:electron transport complex protein RnfD
VTAPAKTLEIRTSPHIVSGYSVDTIMFNVVLALLPTALFGVFAFGTSAALTLATATLSSVLAEHLHCVWTRRPTTVGDWSATITGLLYGLTLPPHFPLWMNVVGGFMCIFLGKALFGGLGQNPMNPALIGRAFLQATFPVQMTTWLAPFAPERFSAIPTSLVAMPFMQPAYDAVTGATPLAAWKFDHQLAGTRDLAMGFVGGSTGETSGALILLGGIYLVARNMMNWRIPVGVLAAVASFSGILHAVDAARYAPPIFMLFSGGLMLGAMFMATDMVASPMTPAGCLVYGAVIGVLTMVIRVWGGLPEGMMYAILLANAISPHIDNLIRPRVYGTGRRSKA